MSRNTDLEPTGLVRIYIFGHQPKSPRSKLWRYPITRLGYQYLTDNLYGAYYKKRWE